MLLRFLNTNLSNYEIANKTFFYAYGFEILRDLDKNYKFELSSNYGSNENYLKATTKIFKDLQENLIDLQQELIKAVTYIYNLNNNKELEKYTYNERLKQNKAMGEYRRTYQQKFMQVRKNKDNPILSQDFETWKKQTKEKINLMKKGKLTEDEVYDWILKNK